MRLYHSDAALQIYLSKIFQKQPFLSVGHVIRRSRNTEEVSLLIFIIIVFSLECENKNTSTKGKQLLETKGKKQLVNFRALRCKKDH